MSFNCCSSFIELCFFKQATLASIHGRHTHRQFRNLVLQGSALRESPIFLSAYRSLDELDILSKIHRVSGAEAEAINATLLALEHEVDEMRDILAKLHLNDFKYDNFEIIRDAKRLLHEFSWHKGELLPGLDRKTHREKKQTSPIVNLPIWRVDWGAPNCISSPRT